MGIVEVDATLSFFRSKAETAERAFIHNLNRVTAGIASVNNTFHNNTAQEK
jgi:hypothetical protein